jgi:hypothetical protein
LTVDLVLWEEQSETTSPENWRNDIFRTRNETHLNVTSSENTLHRRERGSRLGLDVAVLVEVELTLDELRCRDVTDGVEKTVCGEVALLLGLGIPQPEGGENLAVSLRFDRDGVPEDGDFRVRLGALRHDLRRTEDVTTDDKVDVGGVLQMKKE